MTDTRHLCRVTDSRTKVDGNQKSERLVVEIYPYLHLYSFIHMSGGDLSPDF